MAILSGVLSPEQNLQSLLEIYAQRSTDQVSNYNAGHMDYSGDVPNWIGNTTQPEGGYNWEALLDMYDPRRLLSGQAQFDQVRGALEAARQSSVSKNSRTEATEAG